MDSLNQIDNSYITTFDSFSLSLVKKYHYLLNINQNVNIIEANILSLKTKELLDDVMEEEYKVHDDMFTKLISDFCLKDDKDLKKLILSLNNKLNLKYYKKEYLNNYLETFYSDIFINSSINDYENLLKDKINELNRLLDKLSNNTDPDYFSEVIESCNYLLNSNNYDDIRKNLLVIYIPRLPKGSSDNAKNIKEDIKKIIDNLKKLTELDFDSLKKSILDTKDYIIKIIDIIHKLDEKLNKYKFDNDLYDFIDISKMAIKIVKEKPNICNELKEFFIEIMVDEYQDTSDLQEEFITLISNNNLYMVGDIKQSIYRFRNANPNIFKDKYKLYGNNKLGIKIDLLKNFRSRSEVLNNINLIFDYVMDEMIGGASYQLSHRMNFGNTNYDTIGDNKENNNFEVYEYSYDKNNLFSKDEIEAFIIARDINEKIKNNYQVFDKDKNSLRKAEYSDFCILIDRSTTFDLYKKIFLYHKIPLSIYKDEYLTNSDIFLVIKSIYKLLSILTTTKNKKEMEYMFLSIGRSFLFNLSDEYLFEIISNNDYEKSDIFKIINDILIDIENKTISEILDEIIIKFSFYEKLLIIKDIKDNQIKIEYLYTLADTLNNMGYTYHDFVNFIDNIFDSDEIIRFPSNDSNLFGVKIMTIHKSKGLEFPVCYFPGLYKEFNTSDVKERINYSDDLGIIMPYYDNGLINNYLFALYKEHYYDDEISEKIRLFYVALTRAKEKMIFIMPEENDEEEYDNDIVSLSKRRKYKCFSNILVSIKSKILSYIKEIDITKLPLNKDYFCTNEVDLFENNDSFERIIINNDIKIERTLKEESHYSKSNNKLIDIDTKEKMEFGTNIHYYLETIDLKNPNLDGISDMYKEKILNFLNCDLLKDIKTAKIYQEYEFIYENDNEIKNGVIDLLIEYSDHFDIIDYKLKNIHDDAYIKQLKGYQEYVRKISDKKVNIYLYSIMDGVYKIIE